MGTKKPSLLFIRLLILPLIFAVFLIFLLKRGPQISSSLREFTDFIPIDLERDDFFIASIAKMEFAPGKTLIFDKKQKKIFVFNDSMQFSHSMGSPGQGPGDLSQPEDFVVGHDRVYVLDEISKRIDIFSLNGEFLTRIILTLPADIFYSYPAAILVDGSDNLYVAYSLSDHILDAYGPDGVYSKTYLERTDPVVIYRKNLGNSSALGWTPQKSILHFNTFDGRFIEVFPDGTLGRQFGIEDSRFRKIAHDIQKELAADRSGAVQTDIVSFLNFSNFCIDHEGCVYVCELRVESGDRQRLWSFSPDGKVSISEIPLSGDDRIKAIYYNQNQFYFVTDDDKILLAKRRNG